MTDACDFQSLIEAYQDGREDCFAGLPITHNPGPTEDTRREWLRGWKDQNDKAQLHHQV